MFNDLRYAFRMLLKSPGFTAVAVLSLAIGIGASTAIFSLVNAILLRSLPVPNPHELRVLQWSGNDTKPMRGTGSLDTDPVTKRSTADMVSHPLFVSLREQCSAQADIFGYYELHGTTARAKREAFVAEGLMVSDNFLSGLGVRPVLGRLLDAQDNRAGATPTVVICYGWWANEFGLDPGVLGQTVTLNGTSCTVVGVLPSEFGGMGTGAGIEFYVPMCAQPQLAASWPLAATDRWWVHMAARIKPGTSDAQLQAAMDIAFAREAEQFMKNPKVVIEDGRGGTNYDRKYYREPLLLLLSVVGVVILAACANLAGLSLARGASRQHDFAVRAAIGAGRWRLMRQSLTENLLLAILGMLFGIILAIWGRVAISQLVVGSTERLSYDTSLDLRVLGFALGIALLTALLSGLLPALRAARVDPMEGLKSRTALGAPKLWAAKVLVAVQVALSVLLLSGAGLFVRTLVNLVRINPGFATENLLLFQVNPSAAGYGAAQNAEFYDRAQTALAAIPGVRDVALSQFPLLSGMASGGGFFTLPGRPGDATARPRALRLTVSERFFSTLEIPILLGRGFTSADVDAAPKVVVVNEAFTRKHLAGENPIGQVLKVDEVTWEIVGVCRDAKYANIKQEAPPTVYFSFRQDRVASAYFAVRTSLPPLAVVKAARRVVSGIDPNMPLANITTQTRVRDDSIRSERTFATLCGALAGLAVLLSCVGLYGLMAYNVARRTSEIGVRMALGASRSQISWPILKSAMLTTIAGVAVGLPVALALTRIVEAMLYGVEPRDPLTLTGSTIALMAVAAFAAWIPARRAARVDPMVALRSE
jgi:predicted permease